MLICVRPVTTSDGCCAPSPNGGGIFVIAIFVFDPGGVNGIAHDELNALES